MPDQEHKQYIDGKICEIKECPECEGSGEIVRAVATGVDEEYENDYETCASCEGEGYVKK